MTISKTFRLPICMMATIAVLLAVTACGDQSVPPAAPMPPSADAMVPPAAIPTPVVAPNVPSVPETRSELTLNGDWRFQPASGAAGREPLATAWGSIPVPGNWKTNIVTTGAGETWAAWKPQEAAAVWYERSISIPSAWAGRAILLDLDRVSTDALVSVDGKPAGEVRWPAGQVDITDLVTPGHEVVLRLRVLAVDDRTEVTQFMGYINEPTSKANLDNRGIIGKGVRLLTRPRAAHLDSVFVRTSTRTQTVALDIEVTGVTTAGEAQVAAEMLDEKGTVERTFITRVAVPATGKAARTITASFHWPDPRLWDVRQPNRYTLRLTVAGAGLADRLEQPFGFREFWIDGRRFFLNGSEIRLRPGLLQYGIMPTTVLADGRNFGELWPDDRGRRGSQTYDDQVIDQADALGLPISGKAMHMADLVVNRTKWETDEGKAAYRRLMELDLRRWRNCPSIVMWGHSSNVFQWTGDGDPRLLGHRIGAAVSSIQEYHDLGQRCAEAITMIKTLDPTRPVFAHHGTDNGDVYTSNLYLNFLPLQEREEWLASWAKDAPMPWMGVEVGTPLYASLMRGRDGYSHQGASEPHLSEWMAAQLGPEAYHLEPTDLRKIFARYKGTDPQKEYEPFLRWDSFDRILWASDSFARFQNQWYRNTFRSWRTMGMTGGIIPWHQTEAKLFPELLANNSDTLAWIAGPAGETTTGSGAAAVTVPDFTRKDHAFAPGQRLRKQVVLINDARSVLDYQATWEISLAGAPLAKGQKAGRLGICETLFLPIEATLPTATAERTEGTVTLTSRIGSQDHRDTFSFSLHRPLAKAGATLAVFDPRGDTNALLTSLGYTTVPWTAGSPPADTLVIGRHALSDRQALPAGFADWVRNGGRALVCGQDPDWLRLSLHLRTAPLVARNTWPTIPGHPLLRDLAPADLRDWTGAGSLVEPYPYRPGQEVLNSYGWRWGTRGSVCSAAIEKPHRGSWRPLLETEFDLAYTPLMEMEYGAGRLTLCTLDLEARGAIDPVVQRLAAQLLTHIRTAPIAPKIANAIYLGGATGAKLLDGLGVIYTPGTTIPATAQLVLVGADATIPDADLRALLRRGGRVLVLPRAAGVGPLGVQIEDKTECQGSNTVPAWSETAGLSASDLHWKTVYAGRVITGGEGLEIGADGFLGRLTDGAGVALFVQADPTWLPADTKRYFRFSRWRQTRALSQVLANLGATFRQDAAFVGLLEQPDHGLMLAGPWQVALTTPVKESPVRAWNSMQPISELAKRLIRPDAPADAFQIQPVPAYMESYQPASLWRWTDGEVVFRKEVDIPAHLAGRDHFLSIGRVDENEETFVNGESIGRSKHWILARGHLIPGRLLVPGRNVIALRTWDEGIHGGMCGAADQLFLRVVAPDPGFYHPDYIDDQIVPGETEKDWQERQERWKVADNPYRYYRW